MDLSSSLFADDGGFELKTNAFVVSLAVADFCVELSAFPHF